MRNNIISGPNKHVLTGIELLDAIRGLIRIACQESTVKFRGRFKRKVAPFPSSLCILISPPRVRAMMRAPARPSPCPPRGTMEHSLTLGIAFEDQFMMIGIDTRAIVDDFCDELITINT